MEEQWNFEDYKKSLNKPLRQVTLCFLIRDNEVLLAMKKRGFGKGKWNGTGGKPNDRETLEETAIRETVEEIAVTPKSLQQVATLNFYFPAEPEDNNWNQEVYVYLAKEWDGEPSETEEMAPKWFKIEEIPYDEMWSDDRYWLPKVLNGSFIKADFAFNNDQSLRYQKVLEVSEGDL